MKLSIGSTILIATLSCGTVWAANPPLDYKSVAKSDADLSQRINERLLADRNLSAKDWEGLTIAVKNGKAIVRGQVTTNNALKEVRRIVRNETDNVEDYTVTTKEETQRLRDTNDWGG